MSRSGWSAVVDTRRSPDYLRSILMKDETVVWMGRPGFGAIMRFGAGTGFAGAIALFAAFLFAFLSAREQGLDWQLLRDRLQQEPELALFFGLILFAGLACLTISASYLSRARRMRYAVTDRRIVITTLGRFPSADLIAPSQFTAVEISPEPRGDRGTVTFRKSRLKVTPFSAKARPGLDDGLFGVHDFDAAVAAFQRLCATAVDPADGARDPDAASRSAGGRGPAVHPTIEARLNPGETVVWTGRPAPSTCAATGASHAALGGAIAVFGTLLLLTAGSVVAVPLYAVAAWFLSAPLRHAVAALGAAYAVTDRRVLIHRGLPGRPCTSIDPGDFGRIRRRDLGDDRGTITVRTTPGFLAQNPRDEAREPAALSDGFYGVRDFRSAVSAVEALAFPALSGRSKR